LFHGTEVPVEKVNFGNLFREPFEQIWNKEEYTEFRECFERRRKKFEELYASLLDRDRRKGFENGSLPAPPGSCMTCYKMLGF
jgi:MoaA/NifB/PqqE/SkfB family radical SAM enzyme